MLHILGHEAEEKDLLESRRGDGAGNPININQEANSPTM